MSLANVWDTLEEEDQRGAEEYKAGFISSAAPDTPSKIPNQELQRYSHNTFELINVSVKKPTMILMRKTVLVALEMEPSKRDEFLARMEAQYIDDAKRANASESEAREWAEHLIHKVRKAINTIERPVSRGGKNP